MPQLADLQSICSVIAKECERKAGLDIINVHFSLISKLECTISFLVWERFRFVDLCILW
jgi:hypothetical protein